MDEGLLIPLAGMAMVITLGMPLVIAFVRHLDRHSKRKLESTADYDQVRDELRAIHDRLDVLEHGDARLTELEERVDFAERMLAQREQPKIEGKT